MKLPTGWVPAVLVLHLLSEIINLVRLTSFPQFTSNHPAIGSSMYLCISLSISNYTSIYVSICLSIYPSFIVFQKQRHHLECVEKTLNIDLSFSSEDEEEIKALKDQIPEDLASSDNMPGENRQYTTHSQYTVKPTPMTICFKIYPILI